MRKLFAILLLTTPCLAGGPRYVGPTTDPLVYQEFGNVYQDIRNPVINFAQISSETVKFSSITAANVGTLTYGTLSPAIASHLMKIPLQVINQSAATSTTSSSYVNTSLAATITPTSASSKILILVATTAQCQTDRMYYTIKRGTTDIAPTADGLAQVQNTPSEVEMAFHFLDSPATTSATTYTVCIKNAGGTVTTFDNPDNVNATIILMDVQ